MKKTKYIFITGGVVSSLGKGITAASLGRLLKNRGLTVFLQKFDPYINFDPGTMSPYQHGEVFVTDDGTEADLDLGHYERFTDENTSKYSNITTGKIYWSVISKERKGEYLGETVQVIPHITNEIKKQIILAGTERDVDVVITEIGGTVGDIESLPFLEAIRQMRSESGYEQVLYVHVTLVPYLSLAGELKTKPTQHSVKELRSIGIQPDLIVARSEKPLSRELKAKIGLFCNLKVDEVIENIDADYLYEVPLMLHREGLDDLVCKKLKLECSAPDNSEWEALVSKIKSLEGYAEIAIVGKYVELHDAYLSVSEALRHGGIANGVNINIRWVNAESLNEGNADTLLAGADGILVPGGFGDRGIYGKILAGKYAREKNVPYFGICLGMQTAVIEYARNVLNYESADSTEFSPNTPYPVIDLMPEQQGLSLKGGTMRLGKYSCRLEEGTRAFEAYGEELIEERHRHRFEFNNSYLQNFAEKGLRFTGINPEKNLVEIVENPECRWFVGVQFHPELKSRPNKPHPLFVSFIRAAIEKL